MRNGETAAFLRRFGANADGVTAIEFAMIAPVLTLMIAGIVELGMMTAAQRILDDSLFVASRVGKTGYIDTGKTQAATIRAGVEKAASALLDPAKITLTSVSYPDYSYMTPEPFTDTNKNGKWDAGEPYTDTNGNGKYDNGEGASGTGSCGQIVAYTATYNWTLFTPLIGQLLGTNGIAPIKSRIVVKNEPYC